MSCTKAIKLEYVTIFANHRKHGGLADCLYDMCASFGGVSVAVVVMNLYPCPLLEHRCYGGWVGGV